MTLPNYYIVRKLDGSAHASDSTLDDALKASADEVEGMIYDHYGNLVYEAQHAQEAPKPTPKRRTTK